MSATALELIKAESDELPVWVHQSTHADWHTVEFEFEAFVKNQVRIKVDSDSQICPDFAKTQRCPRGLRCELRHVLPSPLNFVGPSQQRDPVRRTVCKHWLRGLCKKSENCDYLHEYDLRRMPECRFFATFGFCNSGDECLYLHVDPKSKRRECEKYRRGFCSDGPQCLKRHVRRVVCPMYIAGFCPFGSDCQKGHPKSTQPSPISRSTSPIQTVRPMTIAEAFERHNIRGDDSGGYGGGGGVGGSAGAGAGGAPAGGRFGGMVGSAHPSNNTRRPQKDLSEVECFKCGEFGHFANHCPNPMKPGQRGHNRERGQRT